MDMVLDIGGGLAFLVLTLLLIEVGTGMAQLVAVACLGGVLWFVLSAIADAVRRASGGRSAP